ncbi:unnamed protein product [Macrosiphum euphorbiae]|uniref:CARD domain-containing protein n=1 Tax=Macrosiphum euphorbiae TaxID=13131 RepID=A0AAV0XXV6_9HEMI|nr:unnamed protein product [Macrosiphum euphorbiae]
MDQYHRKLINTFMLDLISVTFDLEDIVNKLLEATIINEWMKNYILEDQVESVKKTRLYEVIQGRGPEAFTALCRILRETRNYAACEILTSSKTSEQEKQILSSIDLLDTTCRCKRCSELLK